MQLKDDFFTIKEVRNETDYVVLLNAAHKIYAAHFPGNPITPGVCITQIVKELTEEMVGESLFLKVIKNIKFTQIINPLQHGEVIFSLTTPQSDANGYKVSANVFSGDVVFAKLSLVLVKK